MRCLVPCPLRGLPYAKILSLRVAYFFPDRQEALIGVFYGETDIARQAVEGRVFRLAVGERRISMSTAGQQDRTKIASR